MHIARVALRVSDVARSARFYERIAGLVPREEDEEHAVLCAPDGGSALVELRRAARPGRAPTAAAGLFHTALRYPTRGGLARALRRVAEAREPLTGASDHDVSEALYLSDPDGLGVELYRDRPRDEWPEPPPGDRVMMRTLPLDIRDLLTAEDGDPSEPGVGLDVGHVHLKVSDVEEAVAFWTGAIGMELMTRYGSDAAFLADGGYHHHVGVNTWMSRGAALEPREGPGLERVVVALASADELDAARGRLSEAGSGLAERDGGLETNTPDGLPVLLEPS